MAFRLSRPQSKPSGAAPMPSQQGMIRQFQTLLLVLAKLECQQQNWPCKMVVYAFQGSMVLA